MYLINGKTLPVDTPFTVGEGDSAIQYPANWLRHASPEERAAIGITEVADPVAVNPRFYWAEGIPRDVDSVKGVMIADIAQQSYVRLKPTDYKLIRSVETGDPVNPDVLAARLAIRESYAANKAAIEACTTVDELAALTFTWPEPT